MPRIARKKSNSGIYHIIMRGINRQIIFRDNEDANRYIQTLAMFQKKCGYKIYAYCLMGNHVHLLMEEIEEDIGDSIKRISVSYVYWYNWKYERCGHLYQDRYRSETVEDDRYFLTVLRYIHQNPIKAGLVISPGEYRWSSYREYLGSGHFIDKDFALKLFHSDQNVALQEFKKFHQIVSNDNCLEISEKAIRKDSEAEALIKAISGLNSCQELKEVDRARQIVIFQALAKEGLSVMQVSRLTGIGRWKIYNCIRDSTQASGR